MHTCTMASGSVWTRVPRSYRNLQGWSEARVCCAQLPCSGVVSIRDQFMDKEVYSGFIHDCSSLARPFPCIIKVCSGNSNYFFWLKMINFASLKKHFQNKVYIIWKWSWEEYGSGGLSDQR